MKRAWDGTGFGEDGTITLAKTMLHFDNINHSEVFHFEQFKPKGTGGKLAGGYGEDGTYDGLGSQANFQ